MYLCYNIQYIYIYKRPDPPVPRIIWKTSRNIQGYSLNFHKYKHFNSYPYPYYTPLFTAVLFAVLYCFAIPPDRGSRTRNSCTTNKGLVALCCALY